MLHFTLVVEAALNVPMFVMHKKNLINSTFYGKCNVAMTFFAELQT